MRSFGEMMNSECAKPGIELVSHAVLERFTFLLAALSDASCSSASPRLRVGAAHDAAVVAGLIVAELDGCLIVACNPLAALTYLRERSSIRAGLSSHVRLLIRFDRNDYDRIWTATDARRSLTSAIRIQSALRWLVLRRQGALECGSAVAERGHECD